MTCWVVIPVKASGACKTRLAAMLDDAARRALVDRMLRHVVASAEAADGVDRVLLVGPERHGLPERIALIADPAGGLNAAAAAARDAALAAGAGRLILLPADLPRVTAANIVRLAAVDGTAIAPDRHGSGTNALSLPLPQAAAFRFRYGARSFAAHHIEAERLGLPVAIVAPPGLADDLDRPEDLAAFPNLRKEAP